MAGKEAIMVQFDVGSSMYEQYKGASNITRLDFAIENIQLLLQQKILFNKTHEVGLLLFGADEADDGNTFYIREVGKIDFDFARNVSELNQHDTPEMVGGDIFHGIEKSIKLLDDYVKKKKYEKKIFILTNGEGKTKANATNIKSIATKILSQGIKVNIISIDFCNTIDDYYEQSDEENRQWSHDPKQTQTQNKNQEFLIDLMNQAPNNIRIFTAKQAIEVYKQFRSKSIFPRVKMNVDMEITSLIKINCCVYTKTAEQKLPSLKKFSKASEFNKSEKGNKVQIEKKYFIHDDPNMEPIDQEYQIKGYYYGKKLVPVSKILQYQLSYKCDRCLKILGFQKQENLPRNFFRSGVDIILPSKTSQEAQQAFTAIIEALLQQKKLAFARYVTRNNTAPQLVTLIPHKTLNSYCFLLAPLPTAEDIREFQFNSLKECTSPQEQAAAQLIDAMNLESYQEDDDDEEIELVKPTNLFNPILQRFYQSSIDKALNENQDELKELDPIINEHIHPEDKLYEKYKDVVANFKKQFKFEEKEIKKEKPKIFWKQLFEAQENKDGVVQTGATDENDYAEDIENNQLILNKKFNFNTDQDDITRIISTVNPVEDFLKMMNEKKEDLVESAITQLQDIIFQFVEQSLAGHLYDKAMDCLTELRKGCLKEDEAALFNDFLYQVKDKYQEGKYQGFWKKILKNNINLIIDKENEHSFMTKEDADAFLAQKSKEPEPIQEEEAEKEIDLMDELE